MGKGHLWFSWGEAHCSGCGGSWTEGAGWLYSEGGQLCPVCVEGQGEKYRKAMKAEKAKYDAIRAKAQEERQGG